MKKRINNRGLSPVVATVLLVMLVLALASIIFLWARGFIAEQIEKKGQPIENICKDVSFNAQIYSRGTDKLEISNIGNIPIHQFDIKEIRTGGNEVVKTYDISVDAGASASQEIYIDSTTKQIIIYPAILGSVKEDSTTKAYTCLDNGLVLDV